MSLISGVPVSAISSGRPIRARIRSASCSTCCERCDVLFLMKCASSTTMPRKPWSREPADVPVEDLVVDDDDVGEAVDVVAVAVDHGGRAVRRPEPDLAGPVGLDDVGDDDQQREGVGGLGGEQRLRGLAEARLVGEQEGAVALGGAGDHLRLVRASARGRRAAAPSDLPGSGSAMQDGAVAGVLEGAEQRAEQLPAGQPAGLAAAGLDGGEVGHEERVGELPRDDRLRVRRGARSARGRRGGSSGSGSSSSGTSTPPASSIRRRRSRARVGDLGVLGQEHRAARCRARRSWRGSWRSPSSRLSCSARCASVLLVVRLEPWPAPRGRAARRPGTWCASTAMTAPRCDGGLHLAHGAGEHRDDALVVEGGRAAALVARRGTATRLLALALSSQDSSSGVPGLRPDVRESGRHSGTTRAAVSVTR